jgi:hypothetical protein
MALVTPRGSSNALSMGPGQLWAAAVATTEPSDLTTGWTAISGNWAMPGYTDAGSEFRYTPSTDDVEVAEELDPVSTQTTGRVAMVSFAAAQNTVTNLKRAFNGGVTATAGGVTTFEPPDLGTETRIAMGFESEDSQERWVYRQCYQQGDVTITRAKGAAKATIAMEFKLEKPTAGSRLFKVWMQSSNRG